MCAMLALGQAALHLAQANSQDTSEQRAQERLVRQSKIRLEDARETALKRVPGTVTVHELEREKGKLIYSFDILDDKGITKEVHVSAITGKIQHVLNESEAREAAEKRKEANENLRSPRSPLEYKRQVNGEDAPDEAKKAAFTVPARPTASSPAEFQRPGVLQVAYGYNSGFLAKGTPTEQDLPLALRFAVSRRLLVEFDNDTLITQTSLNGKRETGVGSTVLGTQWVIQHQTKAKPAVSFAYYIKVPTASASKGLGTGRADHSFIGLVSKNIGAIAVDFNAIYLLAGRAVRSGHASSGQGALAFSRNLSKNLGGTVEVSGYSRNDAQPGGMFGLTGLSYQFNRRFSVYSGVRFGLTAETARVGYLGGITYGIGNLYKEQ